MTNAGLHARGSSPDPASMHLCVLQFLGEFKAGLIIILDLLGAQIFRLFLQHGADNQLEGTGSIRLMIFIFCSKEPW